MHAHPLLPVEEEDALAEPERRDAFICRVMVYDRWRRLLELTPSPDALMRFHAQHKYLLMAHDPDACRALGRMLARGGRKPVDTLAADYGRGLMAALARPASRGGHANALMHMAGYLSDALDTGARRALHEEIDAYRRGAPPQAGPLGLLGEHLRRHPVPYLQDQHYPSGLLDPS
jgi:uncharacterized protein YbgA (DUF1722 family)